MIAVEDVVADDHDALSPEPLGQGVQARAAQPMTLAEPTEFLVMQVIGGGVELLDQRGGRGDDVAIASGKLEMVNVGRVDDVEAAVAVNHDAPVGAGLLAELEKTRKGADLVGCRGVEGHSWPILTTKERSDERARRISDLEFE